MNFLCKIFGGSYDDLWKAIIRPGRDKYEQEELGPFKFEINGKCYKRTDFELVNNRGLKLLCSFWEPFDEEREKIDLPCVIYLHGNSSSRCEAYAEVKHLLPKNICLFSFDFCGCGKSEGEYISLGHYEKDDVHSVVEYLKKSKKVSKIGLWGRSMGAVTAIMYASEHPKNISALILDSGFYSLNLLIRELVDSKVNLPNFIFEKILKMVKETVKEKAGFDLDEIEPFIYAKNCCVPAFFCHGEEDNFVLPHHCKDLYNDYKGFYKSINLVKGNHNSSRPRDLKNRATEFLSEYLKDDDYDNDETIINCNTYQPIILNNNKILINYNNVDLKKQKFYNNYKKLKHKQKYHSKDKNINLIKNNIHNYINRGNTEENNIFLNKNASQNMRAYSHNKYSKNDLKAINKKNSSYNYNNLNINMININKNRFEENNSNNSYYIYEEASVYTKKPIPKETPICKNRIRSISVNNSAINKAKLSLNNSPLNRNIKNISNKNININFLKQERSNKNNLYSQSLNFLNGILKENNKIENDRNINQAGKTFSNTFFKKYSNNNNTNNLNNYFTNSNNNIAFNNHKGYENQKSDDKINFNFYSSKRPTDKEHTFFRKKNQKRDFNNINNNENKCKNNFINKKIEIKEEKKTINSENTILDENEEIIGRKLPH